MIIAGETYLRENIDSQIIIKEWENINRIPFFLRSIYKFYTITILGTQGILLEIIDGAPGVDSIQKHIKTIKGITDQQIILYYKQITRYRRKSLIENRIPFIIEDGQMFLPFLGMHLKMTEDYVKKKLRHLLHLHK